MPMYTYQWRIQGGGVWVIWHPPWAVPYITLLLHIYYNIHYYNITYSKKNDVEFHKYFEELTERSKKIDFEINIPRMVKRQKHRSNYHTDDPEKYFKISIFLPFLDNLVQQLNDWFINHKTIIAGFYFLISNKNYNQQAIKDLSEFYSNDIDQEVIETEIKLWHTHLEKLSVQGVLDALDKYKKYLFLSKNIWTAITWSD